MGIKQLLKKNFIYTKIYHPIKVKKVQALYERIHKAFENEGENALRHFVECMHSEGISYWLEFGTLLGAYRDGCFVPNELDLDVGAHLGDANKIYHTLLANGFTLIREFHVVGENGLEQTYGFRGTTIDIMYFYEKDGVMWCNGSVFPRKIKSGVVFEHAVTSHHFKKFNCTLLPFLGMQVSVPDNTEEHLIEIYGEGYKVYDPNFKVDFNKHFYPLSEKRGFGFIIAYHSAK